MAINIPKLPIIPDRDIESTYVKINPQDVVYSNFDTSRLMTLTGDALTNSVCSLTASLTGTNSGYYHTIRNQMYHRGFQATFTGLTSDIGIYTLRKRKYDSGLRGGSFTASVSSDFSLSGIYYDSGSGSLLYSGDTLSHGVIMLDDGVIVATGSNSGFVSSITAISYKALVNHTTLNVFCKCEPDQLDFSLNPTAFSTGSVSSYMEDPLTASTSSCDYDSQLVSSGISWQPLVTTVGLYDDDNNLLAVAKLAKPLRKPTDIPLTIKTQIDI